MDYLLHIDNIIDVLIKSGRKDLADIVIIKKQESFTASEILMSVTHELLQIIKRDQEAKNIIEDDVIELNNYCYSIGLMVKA